MAAIPKNLLAIEKKFWTGDEKFYRENVDKSCLVAFPDMSGVMGNKDIAATAKGRRWKDLEIEDKGFLKPSDDVAILTYEARARRDDGGSYKALVSTGYVKRSDGWKLMFHAQTPLGDEKAEAARKAA